MLERRRVVLSLGAAAIGCLLLPLSVSAAAEPLPKPQGEVILTIEGAITVTNGDGMAAFDLAMLEALPARQFVTETPWTKGLHTFTGVPLKVLMARVGARGRMITATALNEYTAEIPIDDGERFEMMVAYRLDGQPMLPSDRGPLWTVYPFSNRPEIRTETYYMRSVWTLEGLAVH
jgi:hypothetical protein